MQIIKNINLDKLKQGLFKTKARLSSRIQETLAGKAIVDDEVMDELEEILISSDIGFDTSNQIIENTRLALKSGRDRSYKRVIALLKDELVSLLTPIAVKGLFEDDESLDESKPNVILIVGVNGSGKTTTVGKLAYNYKKSGASVLIGSADTFRAAANEQLEIWADRAGVEIVQRKQGSDPSAVAYDTLNIAKSKGTDIVLIDTAGRLHTKSNLMQELKKIREVLSKVIDHAPNEVYLVIDGNTGQNAIIQAQEFIKVTEITGLIVTKLDGTAKGGALFQVSSTLNIPIKYIGVGEGIEDLQTFDPELYVNSLFD